MENSSNKKRTTLILYIVNNAVATALLIVNLIFIFNFGDILFLTNVLSFLVLFTINTILEKKWYHFLGCTLPYTIVNVTDLVILYLSYNKIGNIDLNVDTTTQMLTFIIIHFFTIVFLIWTVTACVYKYKFYTPDKSPVCYASYALIIFGFGLLILWEKYMISVDTLFRQADFTFIIFLAGIMLNLILMLLPISKNNQQE